jgi:hypothetical protein
LIKTGEYATDGSGDEAVGKLGMAGVYTDQRLNLSKPWEGPLKKCQGFKPDPGNLAVRHYRGASRNVRHGETVNPPAIERAGPETPHLQRGALDLYPNRRHHSKPDPRLDPTRPEETSPGRVTSRGEIRDPLLSDADRFYRGGSPFSAKSSPISIRWSLNLERTLRHL